MAALLEPSCPAPLASVLGALGMLGLNPDLHRTIGASLLSRLGTDASEQAPILSFLLTSAPEDALPDVLARLATSVRLGGQGQVGAGGPDRRRRSAGRCTSQAEDSPDCEVSRAMLQALQWRAELPVAVRKRLGALDGEVAWGCWSGRVGMLLPGRPLSLEDLEAEAARRVRGYTYARHSWKVLIQYILRLFDSGTAMAGLSTLDAWWAILLCALGQPHRRLAEGVLLKFMALPAGVEWLKGAVQGHKVSQGLWQRGEGSQIPFWLRFDRAAVCFVLHPG